MKKTFKKVLSLLLVTVMVFGAAPLTGFIGLELPKMPSLPEFDGFEKISASVSDFFDGFALKAKAASYTSGIFTYTVSGSNATITGCATSATGAVVVPETVDGYKVTAIANYAFQGCTGITSVDLGKVTTLGYAIFYGCTALKKITFPNTYKTTERYHNGSRYVYGPLTGSSITDVIFEDGFNYIPSYACYNGTSVKNVTLPEYDDYDINGYVIGGSAFAYTAIQTIKLPDSLTKIEATAFAGCHSLRSITVPDNVTSVGNDAFTDCINLTKAHIGKSVISLGSGVFGHCTSLTDVVIGDAVTSIGEYGFSGCSKLANIKMGDKVKTLGNYMFQNCYDLVSVDLGNVATLGYAVFAGCIELTEIIFPNDFKATERYHNGSRYVYGPLAGSSITDVIFEEGTNYIPQYACNDGTYVKNVTLPEYDDYDINGYVMDQYAFANTAIETITLPDSLTKINNNVFQGCTKLTGIVVTDEVTSMGDYAFSGCSSLKDVTIGKRVTSIGVYAFSNCISLVNVLIGKNVSSIGEHTFSGCTRLLKIAMGEKVKTIGHYLFNGCERLEQVDLKNVQTIGYAIFNGCTRLTEITFPNDFKATERYHNGSRYVYGPLAGSSITDVVFEEGIKNIPEYACNDGIYVKNVTLPEYEDYDINGYVINQYAFANTAIETITLPDTLTKINNNAFQGCTLLTDIVVTDEVTSIGDYAFDGCSSLKNVTIGKSVTSIGSYVFNNCIRLLNVVIGKNVSTIGEHTFSGCTRLLKIALGEKVKTIGHYLFNGCERLEQVDLKNVQTIGYAIFNGCTRLTEITFPNDFKATERYHNGSRYVYGPLAGSSITDVVFEDGIKNIPEHACLDGKYVKNVTLPEYEDYDIYGYVINQYAFANTAIETITLPDTLTKVNNNAFQGCTLLTDIVVTDNVTSIGDNAFDGCSSLKNVTIGKSVASIGSYVFNNCARLFNILIGENVSTIGDYTFSGCIRLVDFTMGKNVKTVGSYLFNGCIRLENVDLQNIQSMGYAIFNGCTRFTEITLPNTYTTTERYHNGSRYVYGPLAGSNITDVTLEDGMKTVPNYACTDCTTLTTAYFPKSVTTVKSYAFPTKGKPADVYYEGTEEEWKSILIETNNDGLINATVHYNYRPEVVTYTATFIVDGETLVTYEIEEGAEITVPDDPAKAGYIFAGWTPTVPSKMPAEDVTFTAVFEEIPVVPSKYTAEYYVDNALYEYYVITEGDEIIVPEAPSKEGYTFIGWSPVIPDVMPSNNLEFHAVWGVNSYRIKFIVDGAVYEEYTAEYGSDFPDPEAPSKEGYIFAGWDKVVPMTVPACDMTLTALWEKLEPEETTAEYTIEVYVMNTTGEYYSFPTANTAMGVIGEMVTVDAEELEGFTVDTNKSILSATVAADGSTKLKVYYSRNIYTLTVNLGDETVTERYYFGSMLPELEIPSRDGYTFIGWDIVLPEKMPANDITIIALWEENTTETPEYEVGDIIEFGSYPQSKVTDTALLEKLNALELDWVSYEYYSGDDTGKMNSNDPTSGYVTTNDATKPSDYMKYADVEFGGEKYRAVIIETYRPAFTDHISNRDGYRYQEENGYTYGNVYWFKYEPVEWRVLDPDSGLVLSELIVDSQPYNNLCYTNGKSTFYNNPECTIYANNYEHSDIRAWLNDDFFNLTFDDNQKSYIKSTTLNNSAIKPVYNSKSTTDKVFLLSADEAENREYGFDSYASKQALSSDYAQSQGLSIFEYYGAIRDRETSAWLLRTAEEYSHYVCKMIDYGFISDASITETRNGIRPAITINFEKYNEEPENVDPITCLHRNIKTIVLEPTCKEEGHRFDACVTCGEVMSEIEILPRADHIASTVTINPTCEADGYTYSVCRDCGEELVGMTFLPATGHTQGTWVISIAPSCTEEGEKIAHCTVCGNVVANEVVPATGHTAGVIVTTIPSTCTKKGVGTIFCEVCGVDLETVELPVAGHIPGEWEIVVEATVTNEGKKVKKCTECGMVLEEKILSKLTESKDDESGVIVIYPEDPDEPQITVEVKEERDDTAFNLVNAELPVAGVKLFDITMFQNGKEIQPESRVTVKIPLPEDYKSEYSYVYHINTETKKIEKMNTSIEVINGKKYLVFETTHFSYYAVVEEAEVKVEIRNPSITTIKYGDSIILHAQAKLPAGYTVKWTADNGNFSYTADGATCTVSPEKSGDTTFTATVYDANGNEVSSDTQKMTSKAGFFQKIIAFFKGIFGLNKTYPDAIKF